MKKKIIFCLWAIISLPFFTVAKKIHVDINASGNNDGSTWIHAFDNLQLALEAAKRNDEIWVAKGTYYPSDSFDNKVSFVLPVNVALYGGFEGNEFELEDRDAVANPTILNGDLRGDDVYDYSRETDHQVHFFNTRDNTKTLIRTAEEDGDIRIDGFIITGGAGSYGGGLQVSINGTMTIENCIFIHNTATERGGAIYSDAKDNIGAALMIKNTIFEENTVNNGGAPRGGAIYQGADAETDLPLYIENCRFSHNFAFSNGAAISRHQAGKMTLINCVFDNNRMEGACIFVDGVGKEDQEDLAINCTFYNNNSRSGGSVMRLKRSKLKLVNSISWWHSNTGNVPRFDGNSSVLTIRNCVFEDFNKAKIDLSILDLHDEGNNLFYTDPLFMNPEAGDFRLSAESPVVDRGDDEMVLVEKDVLGKDRIQGEAVDMGAYERQFALGISQTRLNYQSLKIAPNPVVDQTSWQFDVAKAGQVRLSLFDLHGRRIKTIVDDVLPTGKHEVIVNLSDLKTGIYWGYLELGAETFGIEKVVIQ